LELPDQATESDYLGKIDGSGHVVPGYSIIIESQETTDELENLTLVYSIEYLY